MSNVPLPEQGRSSAEVLDAVKGFKAGDADWRGGRLFSLVYHADDEVHRLIRDAYGEFVCENGLSPFAFPSLRKMETEVIDMSASLLGGGEETVGAFTSGGTESILMAVKAARDFSALRHPEIAVPEIVLPVTAHAAWAKAAHYFGLKTVYTPVTAGFEADVGAFEAAISPNAVLGVASAPSYPHGVIDPIPRMAAIARERGMMFHVDACLGGFILPFLGMLGEPIPPFDLSVPGVTSISADVHKYGFSAKGASVLLYAEPELRKHQFYVFTQYPGGVYATVNMTGTRPGGAIASAWAVMQHLGVEGYTRLARITLETTRGLMDGIAQFPKLKILGHPLATVFAFASDEINVYALADIMQGKGWHLDRQQFPPSLHVTVTPAHASAVGAFLGALKASLEEAKRVDTEDLNGQAAMYGMMATLPDRSLARELAVDTLDAIFRTP